MAASSRRIICLLASDRPANLFGLAEACTRFTPQIALRANEAIFLDVEKSARLFEPERLRLWLQTLARRFNISIRLGEAVNTGLALTRARWGQGVWPLQTLYDLADPFETAGPQNAKTVALLIQRLQRLGCTSVWDLKNLPAKSLGTRFGEISRLLLDTLSSVEVHGWPRLKFPERLDEMTDLSEQPCAELEPLLFVLKALLSRLLLRLRAREKRLAKLELTFSLDDASKRRLSIGLATPQTTVTGLVNIIRDKLAREFQMQPLQAVVIGLRAVILETAPGRSAQKDFFHRRLEEAESLENLVGRLQEKLGAKRVYQTVLHNSHRPEAAWRGLAVLQAAPPPPSPVLRLPPRPTRLLKHPIALQRLGDELKETHGTRRWQVLTWQGPERISGEWWERDDLLGFERDYYTALTENGEKLWLFLGPMDVERIYLHGYFD